VLAWLSVWIEVQTCSSKIQIGFTYLVPAHPSSPETTTYGGNNLPKGHMIETFIQSHAIAAPRQPHTRWTTCPRVVWYRLKKSTEGNPLKMRNNLGVSNNFLLLTKSTYLCKPGIQKSSAMLAQCEVRRTEMVAGTSVMMTEVGSRHARTDANLTTCSNTQQH